MLFFLTFSASLSASLTSFSAFSASFTVSLDFLDFFLDDELPLFLFCFATLLFPSFFLFLPRGAALEESKPALGESRTAPGESRNPKSMDNNASFSSLSMSLSDSRYGDAGVTARAVAAMFLFPSCYFLCVFPNCKFPAE